MAEEKRWEEADYIEEGKRIVREYLSGMGWLGTRKRAIFSEIHPAVDREINEERFRSIDQKEEDVEWKFSQDTDRWRKSDDKNRVIVIETILKGMGQRNDLGFFAKRIIERLKKEMA